MFSKKISEAAQVGDYLARVSVSDPDSEENVQINLTLTGGNGRYSVKSSVGLKYVKGVYIPFLLGLTWNKSPMKHIWSLYDKNLTVRLIRHLILL